jgi:hypothetical protein
MKSVVADQGDAQITAGVAELRRWVIHSHSQ